MLLTKFEVNQCSKNRLLVGVLDGKTPRQDLVEAINGHRFCAANVNFVSPSTKKRGRYVNLFFRQKTRTESGNRQFYLQIS